MSDYLMTVITSAFFCTLLSSFFSEKGVGKTAKAITVIVMLCIVILPVIKSISVFSDNFAFPVINENKDHNMYNEESDVRLYRQWLAKVTAAELSSEIENSVLEGIGLKVRVECPWHFSGDDVVFDKIQIYTASDQRYYENIINYVKLHFSFDADCFREVE